MSDGAIYAIGDIHGRYDLLRSMLSAIEAGNQSGCTIVFLGDYIDRGPQSREVIELLMSGPRRDCDTWIILKGNHEEMMIETYRAPLQPDWWVGNGGRACLESFGGQVPEAVIAWCDRLPVSYETATHFFVHAGINPVRPLNDQRAEEMLWIRDKFLMSQIDYGKHIVHGHTPFDEPELMDNRTNLDTGAFHSGILTAARFCGPGGPKSILQAGRRSPAVLPEPLGPVSNADEK